MSFVPRKEWAWLHGHADPVNTDGVDRWTCKATGERIRAVDVIVEIVGEDGKVSGERMVAHPFCRKCGPHPPTGKVAQHREDELFEVTEVP